MTVVVEKIVHTIWLNVFVMDMKSLHWPIFIQEKILVREILLRLSDNEDPFIDELDSYMYQSVGHEMIDLFAQAMELPLYRAEIRGDAKTTDKDYPIAKEGDEVEDLFHLLRQIQVDLSKLFPLHINSLNLFFSKKKKGKNIILMPCRLVQSFLNIRIIVLLMCKSICVIHIWFFFRKYFVIHLVVNDWISKFLLIFGNGIKKNYLMKWLKLKSKQFSLKQLH